MAIGVLVIGESGTGKTSSIKNFDPSEVKILSVHKPILPFRGKYEVVKTPTGDDIIRELHNTKKKNIVIDDFQYILGLPMMKRVGEKGWEKFNEIQQPYADVLDEINNLPEDVIVYITSHVETDDNGKIKIKTIGKALDKYITIEGLFMLVFGTSVIDQHYFFTTQNNGNNTVKTPFGMFDDMYIPNDLKYVEDKIRNYYYMEGAKTDEEISAEDESHKVNEEDTKRKSRRKSHNEVKEENKKKIDEFMEKQDEAIANVSDAEEIPFDELPSVPVPELEKVPRRTRKERIAEQNEDDIADIQKKIDEASWVVLTEDKYFHVKSTDNYVRKHEGDQVNLDDCEEITKEQFNEGIKSISQHDSKFQSSEAAHKRTRRSREVK